MGRLSSNEYYAVFVFITAIIKRKNVTVKNDLIIIN